MWGTRGASACPLAERVDYTGGQLSSPFPSGDVSMRTCRCLAAVALAALLTLAPLPAQEAKAPPRDHTITIDDYFTQADLFAVAISPSGKYVAYTEGRWQQSTDDRKADLWVVESKTASPRRVTF